MGVGALGILGQVPPGLRLTGQPRPSAAIDDAIPHYRRVFDSIAAQQRPAAVAVRIHHAAAPRSDVVIPRIARREKDGAGAGQQRHAAAQFERAGEEGPVRALGFKRYGLARRTAVEGLLDARGVLAARVGLRKGRPRLDREPGRQNHASGGNDRLSDGSGVLPRRTRCAGEDAPDRESVPTDAHACFTHRTKV